jgi:hypothetical protein
MALQLVKILFFVYLIIMIVALVEKDWKLALYWLGASLLQASVIWMRNGNG